jgi:protein-disulfide isomerase
MASRAQQKEQARHRRLAEEQARVAQAQRRRRMMTLLGLVLIAVIVVGVAVVALSGGGSGSGPNPTSAAGKQQASVVSGLLKGIPQSGNTLGAKTAKVTVTEYGDLECPICRDFDLGALQQLITKDVRSGTVNVAYRSLCTATCNGPNQAVFPTQQAAAIAAGQQGHEWDYIELFYHQQGSETSSYVTDSYLNALAKEISGLNFAQWLSARSRNALAAQVTADEQAAAGAGYNSTPTIVVKGPKGQASPIVGNTDYATLESKIKSVS